MRGCIDLCCKDGIKRLRKIAYGFCRRKVQDYALKVSIYLLSKENNKGNLIKQENRNYGKDSCGKPCGGTAENY